MHLNNSSAGTRNISIHFTGKIKLLKVQLKRGERGAQSTVIIIKISPPHLKFLFKELYFQYLQILSGKHIHFDKCHHINVVFTDKLTQTNNHCGLNTAAHTGSFNTETSLLPFIPKQKLFLCLNTALIKKKYFLKLYKCL